MKVAGYGLRFFNKSEADDALWQASADLMLAAFKWPVSGVSLRELSLRDPRHAEDPIGTYALAPEGDLVGYVGVARRPIVDGGKVLFSGHLWTVAVRQDHTRRGLGTALMEMALEQLASEGIEDVTLYTTPGLVAYPIYQRLGFLDHHRFVYWHGRARPGTSTTELRRLDGTEVARVGERFSRNLGGLDGFSVRDGDVYEGWRSLGYMGEDAFLTIDPPGSLEGYIFMGGNPARGITIVLELVGPDTDWYREALRALLGTAKGVQVMVTHRNPAARAALGAEGFEWRDVHMYERMMAKGGICKGGETEPDPGWFLESQHDIF
jgi:GNAT superfamily N-acetyltransferase